MRVGWRKRVCLNKFGAQRCFSLFSITGIVAREIGCLLQFLSVAYIRAKRNERQEGTVDCKFAIGSILHLQRMAGTTGCTAADGDPGERPQRAGSGSIATATSRLAMPTASPL